MAVRSVLVLTLGAAVAEAFMLPSGGGAAPFLRTRAPQVAAQTISAGLVSRAAATPKARARLALCSMSSESDYSAVDNVAVYSGAENAGAYKELTVWLSVRPRRPKSSLQIWSSGIHLQQGWA